MRPKEKMKVDFNFFLKVAVERVEKVRKMEWMLSRVADVLEEFEDGERTSLIVFFSPDNVEITTDSTEISRRLAHLLTQLFVKKFEIEVCPYGATPKWKYEGLVEDEVPCPLRITISPAPPAENCVPERVRREIKEDVWVCQGERR